MSDYKKAQDELSQFTNGWQKEVEEMDSKIQTMYSSYRAEEVLLTDEMRKERMDEIKKKEVELKEHQKKDFRF